MFQLAAGNGKVGIQIHYVVGPEIQAVTFSLLTQKVEEKLKKSIHYSIDQPVYFVEHWDGILLAWRECIDEEDVAISSATLGEKRQDPVKVKKDRVYYHHSFYFTPLVIL